MQIEDISKRVNLLFSTRRTTQLADIINYGLSISELSRQTGIKKARLYRLFDIPTKEELDTIEAALDVMKIRADIERIKKLDMLASNGTPPDTFGSAQATHYIDVPELSESKIAEGGIPSNTHFAETSIIPEGAVIPIAPEKLSKGFGSVKLSNELIEKSCEGINAKIIENTVSEAKSTNIPVTINQPAQ